MNMGEFSEVLKVLLQIANVVVLGYALYKFLNRPHDTLETKHEELVKRVDAHDVELKDIKESLHQGNDKFRKQADINEVFINCMLAFIDFEMAYCSSTGYKDIEDLKTAKATLRKYLARGDKQHEV